jgi:enoyl-CoA hydratase/carnithine racemase
VSQGSIELTVEEGIATITLNRPEQFNTITPAMLEQLSSAYHRCDEDDGIRVVVLTGRGEAFCAGADLSAGGATFDKQDAGDFSSCPLSIQAWEVRKPVIAACNGHAIGVGLSTALQCDIRIFSASAKYGLLQNRRGVVADNAVEYLLPRLIGFERAFEMIVRAPRLNGIEAQQWGLASRAVPADQVLSTALIIARDMAENCSPLIMAMHKRLMWRSLDMSLPEFIKLETRALHHSMGRPDAIEGGMAWFEKRAPRWRSSVRQDWPEFL